MSNIDNVSHEENDEGSEQVHCAHNNNIELDTVLSLHEIESEEDEHDENGTTVASCPWEVQITFAWTDDEIFEPEITI